MTIYRTAQGKTVDMAALAARNERTRAVGNMSVNARGDTIDSTGKVITPVTKKVGAGYKNTVNRATNLTRPSEPATIVSDPVVEEIELLADEMEIEDDQDALEIEALKAAALASAEVPTDFVVKSASEAPEFFEPVEKKSKK